MTRIYLSPPDLAGSEQQLITEALASGWIAPLGPHVDAFEREIAAVSQMPHALAVSSGTAALHLALLALDIGVGDEVWISTLTFVGSVNPVRYVGATPVFIDSDRVSWNMDPGLLEEALAGAATRNALPRAVIAVDLYGQCADYERIANACRQYDVVLIEDAAEALGATYRDRPAGSFGDIAIFSFNGNKIITTSGGGMLLARKQAIVDRARHLATQAREPAAHYEHTVVGYNYRLSNLLAALGRAQLADLARRVSRRREINAQYRELLGDLPGWSFMPEAPDCTSTCWLTVATLSPSAPRTRDDVLKRLADADIEARPVWKPMHAQPLFAGCRLVGGRLSDELFSTGLCLPSGSQLRDEDLRRVVGVIRD